MPLPIIRDPIARSIFQPRVLRERRPSSKPEPMTLYAGGNSDTPLVRLQPGQATVFQLPLQDGEDAPQILAYLYSLSVQFAKSPYVREFTVDMLSRAGVGDNDQGRQVETILTFVRRNVLYIRDPIESEYVISPVTLLDKIQRGQRPGGDCEDHVLLLNSMLGSVGFPTRFIAVRINGADWWNHVISSVYIGGRWVDLDPIAKNRMQGDYDIRLEGRTNFAT